MLLPFAIFVVLPGLFLLVVSLLTFTFVFFWLIFAVLVTTAVVIVVVIVSLQAEANAIAGGASVAAINPQYELPALLMNLSSLLLDFKPMLA